MAPALGQMVSLILPEVSSEMMNLFLEQVSQTCSRHFIVMQVDQAGWHSAKDLVIPENIRLIPQPAYSPELNPVEHTWDELREKYFHNRIFSSLELLIDVLCQPGPQCPCWEHRINLGKTYAKDMGLKKWK